MMRLAFVVAAALLIAACGNEAREPTPASTPTVVAVVATATAQPTPLPGEEASPVGTLVAEETPAPAHAPPVAATATPQPTPLPSEEASPITTSVAEETPAPAPPAAVTATPQQAPAPIEQPPVVARTQEPTPTPPLPAGEEPPVLSLERIFTSGGGADGSGLDPARLRTLVATGDVIPARGVNNQIIARGNDFSYPLSATADILRQADLTIVNLEAPLVEGCPPMHEGLTFCGQPGFAEALADAGVDVATLENNHIGNFGPEGIAATQALLATSGIDYADRHTLAVRDVRGLRFGFLAFNGVGEAFDRELVRLRIEQAAEQVDVVVAAFHWGAEYVAIPQAAPGVSPDDPLEIAHLAVDAGADLVLGNHPHWVQAVEIYAGKLIAYAHGNFIFDQMWSYETTIGVIGRYTFYDSELVDAKFLPVRIEDYARPVPLQGEEAQAVVDGMYQASLSLQELLTGGQ